MSKKNMILITASLGLVFALVVPILTPDSIDGPSLDLISPAWAGPNCDADGDGYEKGGRKCAGTDPDDSDPCDPNPFAAACPGGGGNDGHFTINTIRAGYFSGSADDAVACFDALVLCESGGSLDTGCLADPPAPAACTGVDQMGTASPYNGPYPNAEGEQHHPWTDFSYGLDTDNWANNTLSEAPRPCRAAAVNNLTGGRYECFEGAGNDPWPHGGMISIPLASTRWTNIAQSKSGRPLDDPGFCPLLNTWGELRFGATRYGIYFSDGCDDSSCNMNIFTPSYSGTSSTQGLVLLHPFHDLGGALKDVGKLSVNGYVDASTLVFPEFPEWNVFTRPQVLRITGFEVNFEDVKNAALLATCVSEVSDIWFVTAPNTTPVFP